jgi:hypothetical protein
MQEVRAALLEAIARAARGPARPRRREASS